MKRLIPIVAALACVALGALLQAAFELEDVAQFLRRNLAWIAVTILAGLAILGLTLIIGFTLLERRAQRILGVTDSLTEEDIIKGLMTHVSNPAEMPADQRNKLILAFGTWFMRRETKQFYFNVLVTAVGGLVGTATLFLLYEQNNLITDQNQKITLQTDANIAQSVLLEGSRRASLSGDMAALFNDLRAAPYQPDGSVKRNCTGLPDVDCWEYNSDGELWHFRLGQDLFARAQTFAQRNTPYQVAESYSGNLDFDTPLRRQFQFFNLSPERGQLLETMALAKIRVQRVGFNEADLRNAILRRMNLREAYLPYANLTNADLWKSDFSGAFLNRAIFVDADVSEGNFGSADLKSIKAADGIFNRALFHFADATGADFTRADLSHATFEKATLRNARFDNANLSDTDFSDVDFTDFVSFEDAWAWRDEPPIGLPDFVTIDLCEPVENPGLHPRKPFACGDREWDN